MAKVYTWKPLHQLFSETEDPIALILLNLPSATLSKTVFERLWIKAKLTASVDGATNELFKLTSNPDGGDRFIPDLVTGDFDSVDQEILQFYRNKGAEVIHTPDQNETDFTKCLQIVSDKITQLHLKVGSIVATSGLGGRLDHTLSNINTLFASWKYTECPVYVYGNDTVCCLLKVGTNKIDVSTGHEGSWCGLIPVGEVCNHITTTGLKWNLDNQAMSFGNLISTSNELDGSGEVTVVTDKSLLFILNFKTGVS